MNALAIKELLYKIADDQLIIGHRNSEWTGFGPLLEDDSRLARAITESVACGKNPPLEYIVPGTIITAYTLPGALSISSACGQAECSPAGAPEPVRIMDKGWTWQNFWQ